jgi:tellurite resistance protein TerC
LPIANWIIFNLIVLSILALDLFVFHKKARVVAFQEALTWSGIWIALALVFNVYIYFAMGKEPALNFLTGYLIEKALSVDNLFVFLLIFNYFQTPETSLHKVLFWGILGAIVTRALFILLGITLVSKFHPIIYLFGIFLVITGIRLGVEKEKKIRPEKNFLLKLSRFFLPVTDHYMEDRFFVRINSRLFATPLWIVLLSIETTDIIFSIDSIPAILAITYDPFIVYTSNICAILGLRSLFFLLARSLQIFHYLHYGISVILVFVGIKMLLSDILKISPLIALGIVFAILFISILASVLIGKGRNSPTKGQK